MSFRNSAMALTMLMGLSTAVPGQHLDVPFVPDCGATILSCYPTGEVRGLNPNGDGFLAVRSGPGTQYPMTNKIYNGTRVVIVTRSGPWYGIYYGADFLGWAHSNWIASF